MAKLPLPPGWTWEQIDEAAELLTRLRESYLGDPVRLEKFARYDLAQDVFDDKKVLTHLNQGDIEPYGIPEMRKQVKGVTRMVASAFDMAEPYFILKGGTDSENREAREHDAHLANEAAEYPAKVRESARFAAIKMRGPFRLSWEVRRRGEGWMDSAMVKDQELEFAGPKRESIRPEDLIVYPLSQQELTSMRMIGFRFDRPMFEIWEAQARGEYFDQEDVDIQAIHEQRTSAENEEDWAPNLVYCVAKLPPGMDRSKALQGYECIFVPSCRKMLFMAPYTFPMPLIFAPGFEFDPLEFWATHSLASSMFEPLTMLNDAQTTRMLAGVAASKKVIFVTGHPGEMVTEQLNQGDMVTVRGDAQITPIETSTPAAGDLQALAEEARKDGQGVTGHSDVANGQLPEASQTATATGGALQGTADEGEEKRRNFLREEIRAQIAVHLLIQRNFKTFKQFHGDRLMTKKASDWKPSYTIAPNAQGPQNNPFLTSQKLRDFIEFLTSLGVPWLEDVEGGKAENIGVAISKHEFIKAIEQNMDLPMTTEKIIVDTSEIAPIQDDPLAGGSPLAIGGAEELFGLEGAGLPPELLDLLIAGGPEGMVPGLPMGMAGAEPPPIGIPGDFPIPL